MRGKPSVLMMVAMSLAADLVAHGSARNAAPSRTNTFQITLAILAFFITRYDHNGGKPQATSKVMTPSFAYPLAEGGNGN